MLNILSRKCILFYQFFEAYILYEAIYIVKIIKNGIRTMTEKVIKGN